MPTVGIANHAGNPNPNHACKLDQLAVCVKHLSQSEHTTFTISAKAETAAL